MSSIYNVGAALPPAYGNCIENEGQQQISVTNNISNENDINTSNDKMMNDLDQLIKWHDEGVLNGDEFQAAKNKLIFKKSPAPKDISLEVEKHPKLIGIHPNINERVIIEMNDNPFHTEWKNKCKVSIPPQIAAKGVTEREWDLMMDELAETADKSCNYPCQWIYIFFHMLCFMVLFVTFIWLLYALVPYGWCCDCHQRILKQWLMKYNAKLRPKGIFVKFQTIKKDFHEKKYICFAVTPQEIQKLRSEPIFQRGTDIWHQENGEAVGCPIDSHRII